MPVTTMSCVAAASAGPVDAALATGVSWPIAAVAQASAETPSNIFICTFIVSPFLRRA
jgi:hypothetical protein